MWLTAPTLFLGHPVYIMTQNGPVTAPGSQGVFRG
jgi:hypothetical protein